MLTFIQCTPFFFTALSDRTGTKALVLRRLPHVAIVTDPNLTEEKKAKLEYYIFDVTKEPAPLNKRIVSMTVHYKNLRIDNNSSFFAHCLIYVDGDNILRKKLVDFDDLDDIRSKRDIATEWFNKLKMPPETERFVCVRTGGNFTMALSTKGDIWSRGWTDSGTFTDDEAFTVLPHFKAVDGKLNSSLGPSPVKEITFDAIHVIIILENGAVFAFGAIQEFNAYDPSLPQDGFIELTDSHHFQPRFVESLCGSLSASEGPYGIFGTHKPVKYFRRMCAFLTEDGIPLVRIVNEVDRRNHFYYTPIDPGLFFKGERIVNMNHHMDEMYVTERGMCYIVNGQRGTADIEADLKTPKHCLPLPFPVSELRATLLTKHTHVTLLKNDGKLISMPLEGIERASKDVTPFASELTADERNPGGMIIKWYGHCALSYYFLFE